MKLFKHLLMLVAKPFIGSGIGQKFPWLHSLFKKLNSSGKALITVTIPFDVKLTIQGNDNGPGLYLASTGTFEPFETQLFISLVNKADTVFDIGAHVGYYSTIAGKLGAKVVAFEASAKNAQLLRKNIIKNRLNKILVAEKAVTRQSGNITFYLSKTSSGDNSLMRTDGEAVTLPGISIDDYVKKTKKIPTVMKIDVEGAEFDVLSGALKTLKSTSLKNVFIEVGNTTQKHQVAQLLTNSGFNLKLIDEYNGKILLFSTKNFNSLLAKHGFVNILAQK